jgi:hypothetical protein
MWSRPTTPRSGILRQAVRPESSSRLAGGSPARGGTKTPCSSPPASGETRATKRGVKPSSGGCNSPVRSMKRSLPRRKKDPSRGGTTGSRAWSLRAKAKEGVKSLEAQPRRTPRRRGHGMVGQPRWEQERPVSAPAVRPLEGQTRRWTGSGEPYKREEREVGESGAGVGGGHSTVEARDNRTLVEGRASSRVSSPATT